MTAASLRAGFSRVTRLAACLVTLAGGPAMAQTSPAASSRPDPLITVRIPSDDGSPAEYLDYIGTVLKTALARGDAGPVTVERVPVVATQDRLLQYLASGDQIDVYWAGTSPAREQQLAPVRVPLTAGLLGLRVPVILSERQEEFSQISTLDHLRQYIACQGDQWPDSDILEANGLPVLRISKFSLIYRMLKARRCDYFPRGVTEAYTEVAAQPDSPFVVEDGIILSYRYPLYFFTSKQNTVLHDRLATGLLAMAEDGSLLALLQQHPATSSAFPLSRYRAARTFALANPLLPAETPLTDPRLWLAFPGIGPSTAPTAEPALNPHSPPTQ